ncbi:MAG: NAD(P)/FAD-dependent oxidoreductase [Phycisphaeraceae bacterium]
MASAEDDAVVVGSGPNGLAAAIVLAEQGLRVRVVEGRETIGGGARTAELTEPGFLHDICSAVHPLGVASPFFKTLNLEEHGLNWLHPPVPLVHPLDDGSAVALERSVEATAAGFDAVDRRAYQKMMGGLMTRWEAVTASICKPLPWPKHPLAMASFGGYVLRGSGGMLFKGERARALMGGLCAHGFTRLDRPPAWAIGLFLGLLGHAVGWPIPRGGAQQISDALGRKLESMGGRIETERMVQSLDELGDARAVLFEVTPRQLLSIAGDALPAGYQRGLKRFRYGPGVFKMDFALDGPIPWRAEVCRRAGTLHLGGTFEEVAASEKAVLAGEHPKRPFVLLAQPSIIDASRAPAGKHAVWAYCHVPNGSTVDMSEAIERQIERFAPGFRERIISRAIMNTHDMHRHNPNYIGGDINGGAADLPQVLLRPVMRWQPWTTPNPRLFLCSASTPPGGGIHGMCGYNAATAALKQLQRQK